MPLRSQEQVNERVERVVCHLKERFDNRPGAPAVEAFVRRYFERVAPEDVLGRTVENLYGAALSLWKFADTRRPGTVRLRVYNPRIDRDGWTSPHTVIEIVNDDMPFLVDSVTMALNGLGHTLHLLMHPIVTVRRNGAGRRIEQGGAELSESLMHLEIDEQTDPAALSRIEDLLGQILADVRAAIEDWQPMRDRLDLMLGALADEPPPLDPDEVAEAAALLTWMRDDHFTFLGCREYRYGAAAHEEVLQIVPGSGLGILRDSSRRIMVGSHGFGESSAQVRRFLARPELLIVTKANARSTVHRPVHLDYIGVRRFGPDGQPTGECRFVGLFTSAAYNRNPRDIPLLRRKVRRVVERARLAPQSHDGKALLNILDTYPRDELFQIGEEELYEIAHGILLLQQRPRIRLFVRRDEFGRFASCLVYVPRERYNTELRKRFQAVLEEAFAGTVTAFYTQLGDEPLARIHFLIRLDSDRAEVVEPEAVEARLREAARSWSDALFDTLHEHHGEEHGNILWRRYGTGFPASYAEEYDPLIALSDMQKMETLAAGEALGVNLYRPVEAAEGELRFKLYHRAQPVPLSDCLPMLENMGLKVVAENPFEIRMPDGEPPFWLHDFRMIERTGTDRDLGQIKQLFEDAFAAVWRGDMENDSFNRLVLLAGLEWREIVVLRAYCKYLRQAGIAFSQAYMEDTLAANPHIARELVRLFRIRFDPAVPEPDRAGQAQACVRSIEAALEAVASLDQDRILRRYVNLVQATRRTSFYQPDPVRDAKPYLSLKLDSQAVAELPLPRPMVEIFVYAPQMEGIHLRGGKVARGGIRWSDRREDFRTEVLGLMKAQMVKNAVIVPVGAKGGFVPKRPPSEGGREAVLADGIECYKIFIRGLLDITDNRAGAAILAPRSVVRHDGDDPYLVVAADKGTASFSDIANSVALEQGFWLGDAFASGGSAGYDHKKMAITARGAWETVKRHFRELGKNIQTEDFTVVGIGDMSGDVFGNGMLLSPHIRLLAAFDHRHVFIDPDPDPAVSLAERRRLFELPRSSWADYRRDLISDGGGVFERSAKSVRLTPAIQALLGAAQERATPNELIRAVLGLAVDLLWLGGIGTYVKASGESNAEVGDRANDVLRLDGRSLRAKVVGEGGNLGFTQRGRIEYALHGGRINTDAVDNSAGVDCSDHEVNIKILLDAVVSEGELTLKQRDRLLAEMTEEVAELVLQDNYLQSQALSIAEAQGAALVPSLGRFMRELERQGRLDRAVEFLPEEAALAERQASFAGFTRPELAVLLAYAKTTLYSDLLDSDLPEDSYFGADLKKYFPRPLRRRFEAAIEQHRLRREIIATTIANSIVNRCGPSFVSEMREETEASAAEVARAYAVVREVFGLRRIWTEIEALDTRVAAAVQTQMMLTSLDLVQRGTLWVLRRIAGRLDVAAVIADYAPGAAELGGGLAAMIAEPAAVRFDARTAELVAAGVPAGLARSVASLALLGSAPDIVEAARRCARDIAAVGRVYFLLGERLGLDWLRESAAGLQPGDYWQRLALTAAVDDLFAWQRTLTIAVLNEAAGAGPDDAVAAWMARSSRAVARLAQLVSEFRSGGGIDAARLAIANRHLRTMNAA